jgi:hypothetical protein
MKFRVQRPYKLGELTAQACVKAIYHPTNHKSCILKGKTLPPRVAYVKRS